MSLTVGTVGSYLGPESAPRRARGAPVGSRCRRRVGRPGPRTLRRGPEGGPHLGPCSTLPGNRLPTTHHRHRDLHLSWRGGAQGEGVGGTVLSRGAACRRLRRRPLLPQPRRPPAGPARCPRPCLPTHHRRPSRLPVPRHCPNLLPPPPPPFPNERRARQEAFKGRLDEIGAQLSEEELEAVRGRPAPGLGVLTRGLPAAARPRAGRRATVRRCPCAPHPVLQVLGEHVLAFQLNIDIMKARDQGIILGCRPCT